MNLHMKTRRAGLAQFCGLRLSAWAKVRGETAGRSRTRRSVPFFSIDGKTGLRPNSRTCSFSFSVILWADLRHDFRRIGNDQRLPILRDVALSDFDRRAQSLLKACFASTHRAV